MLLRARLDPTGRPARLKHLLGSPDLGSALNPRKSEIPQWKRPAAPSCWELEEQEPKSLILETPTPFGASPISPFPRDPLLSPCSLEFLHSSRAPGCSPLFNPWLLCKAGPEQPGRKLIPVLIWIRDAHTQQNKAGAAGSSPRVICSPLSAPWLIPKLQSPRSYSTRGVGHEKGEALGK